MPFKSLTQEEASNQVGFQVLIPQPLEETWNNDLIIFSKGKVVVVGHYKGLSISIAQWKSTDETFEFAVNDANLERIQIRNRTGYWLEAVPTGFVGVSKLIAYGRVFRFPPPVFRQRGRTARSGQHL